MHVVLSLLEGGGGDGGGGAGKRSRWWRRKWSETLIQLDGSIDNWFSRPTHNPLRSHQGEREREKRLFDICTKRQGPFPEYKLTAVRYRGLQRDH